MLPIDSLLTLALTSILLGLAPGPDNLFVLTQSALYGRRSGFWVTLGLCTGLVVHTTAVALGVVAIFQTSTLAFNALKLLGAAYLLYLAWQAFTAPTGRLGSGQRTPAIPPAKLYRRGIIMNITNPKVSMFFLAFLPQFASPEYGPMAPQIFLLGFIFILATLLVFNSIAILSARLGDLMTQSARAQRALNRIAGTVFLALAAKLMLSGKT